MAAPRARPLTPLSSPAESPSIASLRAQEIDPCSAVISGESGRLQYVPRRYQDAVTESQKMMATRGDAVVSYRYLGLALEQLGRFGEAVKLLRGIGFEP